MSRRETDRFSVVDPTIYTRLGDRIPCSPTTSRLTYDPLSRPHSTPPRHLNGGSRTPLGSHTKVGPYSTDVTPHTRPKSPRRLSTVPPLYQLQPATIAGPSTTPTRPCHPLCVPNTHTSYHTGHVPGRTRAHTPDRLTHSTHRHPRRHTDTLPRTHRPSLQLPYVT